MKVLHVITDTDRRGAQVFATDLSAAMSALGHDSRTVALAPGNVGGLSVPVLARTQRMPGVFVALRRAMAESDITVAHGSSTVLACAVSGFGPGRPFMVRQISETRFWVDRWSRRLRVRAYLSAARQVVALADSAAGTLCDYLGVPARKISVIPNGVAADGFAASADPGPARARFGLPVDALVLGYVGALVPEKGVDMAIGAVASTDGALLLVVGDGPQRAEFESLADRLAPGRVVFVGSISATADAFAAIDLFLFPSRGGDSMPAVLIEAGFCGRASLTTDVGAIADIVEDGVTGRVVRPNDQVVFDNALGALLGDRTTMAEMGVAARLRCLDRFEIGVVARQWVVEARRCSE